MARVKHTPEMIEKVVRRYMNGEQVRALAKELKVSVPAIYVWIKGAKEAAADQAKRAARGPDGAAKDDMITLRLRLGQLEQENELLKKRLFAMLIKHGEL